MKQTPEEEAADMLKAKKLLEFKMEEKNFCVAHFQNERVIAINKYFENRIPEKVVNSLTEMGYKLKFVEL